MHPVHVIRDTQGDIPGFSAEPGPDTTPTPLEDTGVQAFLRRLDVDLMRVPEDVIDLLVARGVFRFTDLPESAQRKLMFRKTPRSQWQSVPNPLGVDKGFF